MAWNEIDDMFSTPEGGEPPQTTPAKPLPQPEPKPEYYRFNIKLPIECKDYLQEMAWRHRTTITNYLTNIILADMDAHPEWKETIDVLNK